MSTLQRLADRGLVRPPRWLPGNVQYETIMGSVAYDRLTQPGEEGTRTDLDKRQGEERLMDLRTTLVADAAPRFWWVQDSVRSTGHRVSPSPRSSSMPFSGKTGSIPISRNPWRCGSES